MSWRAFLRSCRLCGSFYPARESFCTRCHQILLNRELEYRRQCERDLLINYLFRWNENSSLIARLIYSLKGGRDCSVYRSFALNLVAGGQLSPQSLLVPAPSRSEGEPDHASSLAKALAQITGLRLHSPLKRSSEGPQKRKSQQERHLQKLQLKAGSCEDYRDVVFVDDVVTTGATARAAFEALGRPKFQVFALAYRPLLRP